MTTTGRCCRAEQATHTPQNATLACHINIYNIHTHTPTQRAEACFIHEHVRTNTPTNQATNQHTIQRVDKLGVESNETRCSAVRCSPYECVRCAAVCALNIIICMPAAKLANIPHHPNQPKLRATQFYTHMTSNQLNQQPTCAAATAAAEHARRPCSAQCDKSLLERFLACACSFALGPVSIQYTVVRVRVQ